MFYKIYCILLCNFLFVSLLSPNRETLNYKWTLECNFLNNIREGNKKGASDNLTELNNRFGKQIACESLHTAIVHFYRYNNFHETDFLTLLALHPFQYYVEKNKNKIIDHFTAPQHHDRGTFLDVAVKRGFSNTTLKKIYILQPVPPLTPAAQSFLDAWEQPENVEFFSSSR